MTVKRVKVDAGDNVLITRISQKILAALPAAGWKVAVEDDHADLKDYVCSRDDDVAEAFTRLDLIVMTPELESTDEEGLYVHFHFFADPTRIRKDTRSFGKYFRKDNCEVLQIACEDIMQRAFTPTGQPLSVRVIYRPKNTRWAFGEGAVLNPAYRVEISYWVGPDALKANTL